jgi:hypothetical protein
VHCYLSEIMPSPRSFSTGAWLARSNPLLIFDKTMWTLIRWHEKHSIIKAWGSQELESMLKTFSMAGSSDVADQYFLEFLSDIELPSDGSAEEEDDFW